MISNKSNQAMITEILEDFAQKGVKELKDSLERLLNELMLAEREDFVGASPYERTPDRNGYCNGFKNKKLFTTSGELDLHVPQVRDASFYPSCLEKGQQIDRALKLALAEAYVQGVSTRRVKKLTEQLCGKEISSSQVSRIAKVLDEEVERFKKRKLGTYIYLFLDATYEKVRHDGSVKSLAVLKAVGINKAGDREILGISCSLSEAEIHWRHFLEDLIERGLKGVQLIISDDHKGLRKSLEGIFPSVSWQRCLFSIRAFD